MIEPNRSSTVKQSEKHELELGHRKRKGMTGHPFNDLFKNKRQAITAGDEELERPSRLPRVGSNRNGVSGSIKVEVKETVNHSKRMVNYSMPELSTREMRASQIRSLNLAGPVSIGKSVEANTDPSTLLKTLISESKKDRDTVLAMGKAGNVCAPDAVSSLASGRERRDSEENCVAFSKRLREDRHPVKEEHRSYDGTEIRDMHNTLIPNTRNRASLIEDRVVSKACEKRPLNSSCKEDEAYFIDVKQAQSKKDAFATARPLISEKGEKETVSIIKKVQMCSEKQMLRLVEQQHKEIQEFHRSWVQKRVVLEKNHKVASARICSEHRHPESTRKLEILDKELATKMEQYKQQKEKSLKELEEKHLASRNDEIRKAAQNREQVHIELPLHGSQNRNRVGHSGVSENGPLSRSANIVPEVGAVKKEPSIKEVSNSNETFPNGKSSIRVSVHNSETEVLRDLEEQTASIGTGSIPCEVGMDIDTSESGIPVLELDNGKTDRGDQVGSKSATIVKKPNDQANNFISSNLSTIGEKCLVEDSLLKENDRDNHLNSVEERDSSSILSGKEQLNEPQNTSPVGEISKLIKKIQKKCEKRMKRLVQKHEEEIQEFNRLWEQKWVILEKSQELELQDLAINSSMQRFSGRVEKPDALNSEFSNKKKEYKHQKEMFLKDLEQKQLAERNEECKKAAHWLSEAKSIANEDRADGEPSLVGNSETSEHGMQNGPENIDSLARDLAKEQTPDEFQEKQTSDDVCTMSQAKATAQDTLKDHDALAVLSKENSDKENIGGNLMCCNMHNIQDDYITAEKDKVPPPESSDVAQLDHAKRKDPLVEVLTEEQPSLSMNLHATPTTLPPACELVHVPEAILQTGVEGANSIRGSDCDETMTLTSPHFSIKKLSPDGKRSIVQAEGVLTKQGETAPPGEVVGFQPVETETADMEESNENILVGCNVVRKVSDRANSIIPSNSLSCGHSPDHPVVSAICDLPLPHNLENQNRFSQPLSCNILRDANCQGGQNLWQQDEVFSPEVESTVPPVAENQTDSKQATGLVHESTSGLLTNLSQDAVVLPQVVEPTADAFIHSILQSEPNLSCQDSINHDQVSSLILTYLQNASEKISYEKEQVTKYHEDLNLGLEYECAKEKEEMIAKIKSKYESNMQDAETNFVLKKKQIESLQNKVISNEKLLEAFRFTHLNPSFLTTKRMQQVVSPSFLKLFHQLPPLQLVPRPSSIAASSSSSGPPSASHQVSVRPPPLQLHHQSTQLLPTMPPRPPTITSINPVPGNLGVRNNMRAPAPHFRPFRPPASASPPPCPPPLSYLGPQNQQARGNPAEISHSPPIGSLWLPPPSPHPLSVSTNQSRVLCRQQPETAGASTSTPGFTELSALRFLFDMDNL